MNVPGFLESITRIHLANQGRFSEQARASRLVSSKATYYILVSESDETRHYTGLTEAQVLIEDCRKKYNRFRKHSSLDYLPPAPETINPKMEILT